MGMVGEGLVYLDPGGQGSGTSDWLWQLSSAGMSANRGGSWEPRLHHIRNKIQKLH